MISKNAIGLILLALSTIGLNVMEQELVDFISAVGTIVSFALLLWNQIERKDVDWFFWKK